MKTYQVWVTRTSYACAVFKVEAKDKAAALKKALDIAGDNDFPSPYDADYSADNAEEMMPKKKGGN